MKRYYICEGGWGRWGVVISKGRGFMKFLWGKVENDFNKENFN